jgi:putative transposase
MKGKRYSEEQIVRILGEVRGGKAVASVCREYGVAEGTIYRWKTKYGELAVDEVRRLKELQTENHRLKQLVADMALDNQMLKHLLGKD